MTKLKKGAKEGGSTFMHTRKRRLKKQREVVRTRDKTHKERTTK